MNKSIFNNIYIEFQPIYSCDKVILGYEALMRFKNDTVTNVINSCKTYKDYYTLEYYTVLKAFETYKERGYTELLFINSFAHVCLKNRDLSYLINLYPDILPKLVVEILEYTDINIDLFHKKQLFLLKNNSCLAIDDFKGTVDDYKKIYHIQPKYIKLDKTLITNIHKDKMKQESLLLHMKLLNNNYNSIIAEGIENKKDFEFLKNINIPFYQGYYLGKPK